MSEAELQKCIIALAHVFTWKVSHFRPARTAQGWRTPVGGDGAGFPDLLLLNGSRIMVAELKAKGKKPTPDQVAWLQAFRDAGVEVHVWTPVEWHDRSILEALR